MHCTAYPLRRRGIKLPPDEVRAGATPGTLRVRPAANDRGALIAEFFDDLRGWPALSCLHQARLLRIERGGLLIAGIETAILGSSRDARMEDYAQAWWCVPDRLEALPEPGARRPAGGRRADAGAGPGR